MNEAEPDVFDLVRVLALPVAPPEAVADLQPQADELVCLSQPEFFGAVGSHYADFHQVSDEEVIAGPARVAREIPCAQPARAASQGDTDARTH